MIALFNIKNYRNIAINPEISFSDVMDGTSDMMSFSFIYPRLREYCFIVFYSASSERVFAGFFFSFQFMYEKNFLILFLTLTQQYTDYFLFHSLFL